MTRVRIAGAVLLVVLGAGLLTRINDQARVPPTNPASVLLEVRAVEGQPVTETVDLRNGNLHLTIDPGAGEGQRQVLWLLGLSREFFL
jgi:hypothetical protein